MKNNFCKKNTFGIFLDEVEKKAVYFPTVNKGHLLKFSYFAAN